MIMMLIVKSSILVVRPSFVTTTLSVEVVMVTITAVILDSKSRRRVKNEKQKKQAKANLFTMSAKSFPDYEAFKELGGQLNLTEYFKAAQTLKRYNYYVRQHQDKFEDNVRFLAGLSQKERQDLYQLFNLAKKIVTKALEDISVDPHGPPGRDIAVNLALKWPKTLEIVKSSEFYEDPGSYHIELYPLLNSPDWVEKEIAKYNQRVNFSSKLADLNSLNNRISEDATVSSDVKRALKIQTDLIEQLSRQLEALKSK